MNKIKNVAVAVALLLAEPVVCEHEPSEGMTFHPIMSYAPPLQEAAFESWKPDLTTVFLKNKIVLSPEGVDLNGYLEATHVSVVSISFTGTIIWNRYIQKYSIY